MPCKAVPSSTCCSNLSMLSLGDGSADVNPIIRLVSRYSQTVGRRRGTHRQHKANEEVIYPQPSTINLALKVLCVLKCVCAYPLCPVHEGENSRRVLYRSSSTFYTGDEGHTLKTWTEQPISNAKPNSCIKISKK